MNISRIAVAGALLLFLSGLLLPGQTLVEAAKKEKERREALKGKTGVVVTNADLVRTKKKPAVTQPAGGEQPPDGVRPPGAVPPPGGGATPDRSTEEIRADQARRFEEGKAEIQGRLKAASDLISLLNLKMAALQQQFYSFNSMTSREQIQKDISANYLKIQSALADEAKTSAELEKFVIAGRAALPPIR